MEALTTLLTTLTSRVLGDRFASFHGLRKKLPWSSALKVSGRASEIIRSASESPGSIDRTMAYLCEQVPGLSLSSIEGFIRGMNEIEQAQIRSICSALGASFDYLWRGDGHPFAISGEYWPSISQYLSLIRGDGVDSIIFVRGDRTPHVGYVVLKYNEFKYRVLPHRWHISSVNGGGGAGDLVELARLSQNIQKIGSHGAVVRGVQIPARAAEAVLLGDLHPRSIWKGEYKISHWWDDIADVDHQRACAKEYAELYDREFFAAQRIIKSVRDRG